MARSATLECPECDHVEDPLLHRYQSSCGGVVYFRNGRLECEDCGMRIYKFQCDNCDAILDEDSVS